MEYKDGIVYRSDRAIREAFKNMSLPAVLTRAVKDSLGLAEVVDGVEPMPSDVQMVVQGEIEVTPSGVPVQQYVLQDMFSDTVEYTDREGVIHPAKTKSEHETEYRANKISEAQNKAIQAWKESRLDAVSKIVVTVNMKQFNGDELSQTRMNRAWALMADGATQEWSLADTPSGVMTIVTKEELIEACKLAGAEQTRLWRYVG